MHHVYIYIYIYVLPSISYIYICYFIHEVIWYFTHTHIYNTMSFSILFYILESKINLTYLTADFVGYFKPKFIVLNQLSTESEFDAGIETYAWQFQKVL